LFIVFVFDCLEKFRKAVFESVFLSATKVGGKAGEAFPVFILRGGVFGEGGGVFGLRGGVGCLNLDLGGLGGLEGF
jgi:hypothetical protein